MELFDRLVNIPKDEAIKQPNLNGYVKLLESEIKRLNRDTGIDTLALFREICGL